MKTTALVLSLVGGLCLARVATAQTPAAAPPPSPPPYGMPLDGDQAQQAITAAEAEARQNHWALSFAAVDSSGELIMFKRMAGAPPFTGEVAIKKAKTAAALRAPSKTFAENAAKGGPPVWLALGLLPVEGGIPILVNGKMVGAIGASGAQSSQDAQAASRGASAVK